MSVLPPVPNIDPVPIRECRLWPCLVAGTIFEKPADTTLFYRLRLYGLVCGFTFVLDLDWI